MSAKSSRLIMGLFVIAVLSGSILRQGNAEGFKQNLSKLVAHRLGLDSVRPTSANPSFQVVAVEGLPAWMGVLPPPSLGTAVTYEWRKDGVALPTESAQTLIIYPPRSGDAGGYSVQMSGKGQPITSAEAPLVVVEPPRSATSLGDTPKFNCGIVAGGRVSCTESPRTNSYKELNSGAVVSAITLALGVTHGCAVQFQSGNVACWGNNAGGQAPATRGFVQGLPVKLSAGETHTCALLTNGAVECWGNKKVNSGPIRAVDIRSTFNRACAKILGGSERCW